MRPGGLDFITFSDLFLGLGFMLLAPTIIGRHARVPKDYALGAMILIVASFLASAFGTFLLRQGFLSIPKDLRDAAELDGLGHLAFLRRVALPVTRPLVASFTLVAFLAAWNQYTWPRVVVTDENWETIQIGLKSLAASNIDQLNLGFAAAIIAALPILVLLLAFQKQIVRGLTAGAVKG